MLRDYGQERRCHHVEPGLNSRLDELHAAILRSAHLPRLDGWLRRRAEVAARYDDALEGRALRPVRPPAGRSANHLYAVEVLEGDAEDCAARLAAAGVAVGPPLPGALPRPAGVQVGRRRRRRAAHGATAGGGRAVAAAAPVPDRSRGRPRHRDLPAARGMTDEGQRVSSARRLQADRLPRHRRPARQPHVRRGRQPRRLRLKRIFYLYDVPGGESRAGHALKTHDAGAHRDVRQLRRRDRRRARAQDGDAQPVVLRPLPPPLIWREIDNFSSGAVCLVLASRVYDEDDYYREYAVRRRRRGPRGRPEPWRSGEPSR